MTKRNLFITISLACTLVLSACNPPATPSAEAQSLPVTQASPSMVVPGTRILRVVTHNSFDLSEDVLNAFQQKYNVEVQFIKAGDTGTTLNKAILSKDNPIADVLYGVDNTFLGRALEQGIFESSTPASLQSIPSDLLLDPENRVVPVDYGDVCLNYDVDYFNTKNLTPPQTLADLTKPEYKGLLVVQNPAMSSPGLAFLLTTIGVFGDPGYLDFWKELVANDVKIVNDWESAYYTEFTRYGGTHALVVSYSSSPVYEILGAETKPDHAPTRAVIADDTCFRQIEFAGILKGTPQKDLAQAWLDFMLTPEFQADIPGKMYMLPAKENTKMDTVYEDLLVRPAKTVTITAQEIKLHRQDWLKTWTETILR